ncbi:hypothetical protein [Streptomyces sp. R33]|uniref:Uncharacterized protein n=1 Tax=Streptomyces sp. R33 TaxID=3238629 RepID=A0AB39XWL5_9ACTN
MSLLARCAGLADLDTLTALAVEDDTQAAVHAVHGIARLRDPRTIDALCRILERPDELGSHLAFHLHAAAFRGLSGIDHPAATDAVLDHYMREAGHFAHSAAREAVNALADRQPPG